VNLGDRTAGNAVEIMAGLTLDQCVEELKHVIRAAGPDPVMIAHGMGWVPTLKASQGEDLAGLLLISPPNAWSVPNEAARPLRLLRGKYLVPLSLGWSVRIREGDFARYWLSRLPVARHEQVLKNLVPESSHLIKLLFQPSFIIEQSSQGWPVLVMGGTEDPVAPMVSVRQTAECREYSGHGHWLLEEEGWEAIVNDAHRWWIQGLGEAVLLNPS
jgi:pimeloyl-ACP methyl ester carboxylesterase